jgi:2-dehydropantoate 2-reductase
MNTAIVGAGSIGSYLALRAMDAGHRPLICAHSSTTPARIESGGIAQSLGALEYVDDPRRAARAQLVLLAVKAQDVPNLGPWLEALVDERTMIVVVQNGIEHEQELPSAASPARGVLPALAYVNVERRGPGDFVHRAGERVEVPDVGEAKTLAEYFSGSGLDLQCVPDFKTAAWLKLLGNAAANPLTTLTTGRLGILSEDDRIGALAEGLIGEAIAVGAADGARLDEHHVSVLMETFASFPPRAGTSMLFDRLAKRPLEHRALTGVIMRKAAEHGIDVPLNTAIFALLDALDRSLSEAGKDGI